MASKPHYVSKIAALRLLHHSMRRKQSEQRAP